LPDILVVTLQDGSTRWINARPANPALIGGELVGYEMRPMSIEWEALDPYWYGSWGSLALDEGYLLDAGWLLDSSAEVLITGAATFDTLGTADVERIRVRFTGPSAGPVGVEIPNAVPLGFTVNRILVAGEVLDVDNFTRTVTLGGASLRNLMILRPANEHGEYLRLPAGSVTLHATGRATETRVLFTPTFL
jgi:hypothetical protein